MQVGLHNEQPFAGEWCSVYLATQMSWKDIVHGKRRKLIRQIAHEVLTTNVVDLLFFA